MLKLPNSHEKIPNLSFSVCARTGSSFTWKSPTCRCAVKAVKATQSLQRDDRLEMMALFQREGDGRNAQEMTAKGADCEVQF